MKEKVLVIGHKNPDTDSIMSALSYAYLKQQLGMDAEPVRLGNISKETAFALDYFGVEAPRLIEKAKPEVDKVILVDHNERQQSVDDIADVQIIEVIDHHRIANFETEGPLYFRSEPVGCSATIINKMFKENNVDIPKEIAGLMVSAIVSDSLLFKSPTFTEEDRAAALELAEIAQVDIETYGLDMLKAGADLSDKTAEELIGLDSKEFGMGDYKVEVAQVNAVDVNDILSRQEALEEAMKATIDQKGLDLFALVTTDILNSNSVVLALGEQAANVEKAFDVTLENNTALLEGVVSRKKQIIPQLTEAMK
ncbi:manganese-dependent inorganic pyrophosphatase [Planococcaceae bacterium Storch 2/2-2]|nr:manganese-dependent inorganic pyrophosphatase [Planococcaceae bacterium Storch 2/2-2]